MLIFDISFRKLMSSSMEIDIRTIILILGFTHLMQMLADGGLMAHLKKHVEAK